MAEDGLNKGTAWGKEMFSRAMIWSDGTMGHAHCQCLCALALPFRYMARWAKRLAILPW